MSRLAYLLRLSRPRFWLYLAGPVAVAVVYAAETPGELFTPATLALFAYFLVPANVYLYGVNDLFDAEIDEVNPKKSDREVRYSGQPFVLPTVVVCGLGLAALFPLLDRIAWPWLLAYVVLATGYSVPPLRFKTTPVLDSLSNGLYVLPGAAAYATVAGVHPPLVAVVGAWLWSMAMHTFSAIPDIDPDRRAGVRTTATVLGKRWTYAYCFVLWGAAAIAFSLYHPLAGIALGLYPALVAGIALSSITVERAYWWYPAINTAVGTGITLWALVQLVPPGSVV